MAGPPPEYVLAELLVSMFDAEELRGFIASFGPDIERALPGKFVPVSDLAFSFVETLRRHGAIDAEFRDALLDFRPRRAEEIDAALHRAGFSPQLVSAKKNNPTVFLSYHRADSQLVELLADHLRLNGLEIFLDVASIDVGASVLESLNTAIRHAAALVVLLTEHSVESRWVLQEISAALSFGTPVLPIVSNLPDDRVPVNLQTFQYVRLDSPDKIPEISRRIAHSIESRSRTTRGPGDDPELLALVVRFMAEAGRELKTESRGLVIPEPIHIQRANVATALDVRMLAERVEPNDCGYLVHREELTSIVQDAILDAAMTSKTLVPLSERQMQATLVDSRAQTILDELTTCARGSINLFEASNSIQAEWEFFGRSGLLQGIGDALGRGQHIYLTGTRKAGKTSFLNLLRVRVATRPCVPIDLQAYGGEWPSALFADIVAGFDRWAASQYRDKWTAEPPGSLDRLEFVRAMRQRHAAARALGLRDRVLVLLDELERIMPRRDDQAEARRFVDAALGLRTLAQGADACLSLFIADLRPEANRINLFENVATNPFFEFFREMKLPNFSPGEVAAMVKSLARRMGVSDVDWEFTQELYARSGGHARLARMLAAAAWDERVNPRRLTAADLERGLEALADRDQPGRFFDENFWRPLLPAERVVLLAAAQAHPLDRPRDGLTPSAWSAARGSLRDQSLLTGEKVAAEAFRGWLVAEKLAAEAL